MKLKLIPFLALGFTSLTLVALEAPQKIEPLAPNQAPAAQAEGELAEEPAPEEEAKKPVVEMPQVAKAKAYLGLGIDPLPEALANHLGLSTDECALVRILDPNGPAAAAGLKEFDIIVGVDGAKIKSQPCLSKLMEKHQSGDEVKIAYLHRGQPQEKSVKLAARPDDGIAAIDGAAGDDMALPKEMLNGLPKEMRDAIEKNLKALGANGAIGGAQAQIVPMDANGMPELQKRVEKMMQGMQMQIQPGAPGAPGAAMQMKSTLKMMDKEGNIEISRDGESCEAKVFDKQGELLWSGPYQTPQDKAAVPPPVRERLDALNLDTTGNGIQLRMMPRR